MQILMIAGWGGVMNAMQPLQQHLHQLGHQVDLLDFFSPHDDVWHDVLKQLSHYHMVVGWSLGGQLATLLAHEAQQQGVHLACVCIASNPCFVVQEQHQNAMPVATFEQFVQGFASNPSAILKRFAHLVAMGDVNAKIWALQLQQQQKGLDLTQQACLQGLTQGLHDLKQLNTWHILPQLKHAQYHIFAADDALVPSMLMQDLQQIQGDCTVQCVANAGHIIVLSHAEILAKMIDDFCNKNAV